MRVSTGVYLEQLGAFAVCNRTNNAAQMRDMKHACSVMFSSDVLPS